VRDTGIGIASDKLANIFSAFTQADSSTTRRYGGSGLGLTIAQRLVTLMGGKLWAESVAGKGSSFYFTAQLKAQEGLVDVAPPVAGPNLQGVHTLVIDDNAAHSEIVTRMLTAKGGIVEQRQSVVEGIAAIEAAKRDGRDFRLLLIDSEMPEMESFEAFDLIRRLIGPSVPIVMMVSPIGLTTRLTLTRRMGMAHYAVKPIKRRELYAAIAEATARAATPALAEAALQNTPAPSAGQIVNRPLKILLADDSPDNRLLVRAYLKKTPYVLEETENGQEAFDRFVKSSYDIVLMDIQMPILDGYSAVRIIRKWERDNAAPSHADYRADGIGARRCGPQGARSRMRQSR